MTNHITKLQEQLDELEDKGDPSPSRLAILQIAATLALAQEVRSVGKVLCADRLLGELADFETARALPPEMEIGQAVKPFTVELHGCTQAEATCESCPDIEGCVT